MTMVFGGSIRFSTANLRSDEYPTSSPYPANLRNNGKVELQTTSLTKRDTVFDFIAEAYGVKYYRAVKCLTKHRAGLLAFYDVPAKHWKHIRKTNPLKAPLIQSGTEPPRPGGASADKRRWP
jgi:hypothetical protein